MEATEPVRYDARTVTRQLEVLREGASCWSAEDVAAWAADLLTKYEAQLSRRTLLLDDLKLEVRVLERHAGLTGFQCEEICKWTSELVPDSKVAELIGIAKRRVFADPPTPVQRGPPVRASGAVHQPEPSGASSRSRAPLVSPGDTPSPGEQRPSATETEWEANVVRAVLLTC